jgi:hypothetical protein
MADWADNEAPSRQLISLVARLTGASLSVHTGHAGARTEVGLLPDHRLRPDLPRPARVPFRRDGEAQPGLHLARSDTWSEQCEGRWRRGRCGVRLTRHGRPRRQRSSSSSVVQPIACLTAASLSVHTGRADQSRHAPTRRHLSDHQLTPTARLCRSPANDPRNRLAYRAPCHVSAPAGAANYRRRARSIGAVVPRSRHVVPHDRVYCHRHVRSPVTPDPA